MGSLTCYLIEFACKNASPGRVIVIAPNCCEAINKFLANWDADYEEGLCDIPAVELERLEAKPWCKETDLRST